MKKETGGTVFQTMGFNGDFKVNDSPLTVRDYFAGQAVPGIIAFPGTIHDNPSKSPNLIASLAYEIADAMIAERSKE